MNLREKYPVSDFYEVLDGFDIYRSDDLIVAIVAVKSKEDIDVRFYRWHKKAGEWKVDLCRMSVLGWNMTDIYNKISEFRQKFMGDWKDV